MNDVTAIIIAKHNPPHLLKCIQSVSEFADEIILGCITLNKALFEKLSENKKVRFMNLDENIPFADIVKEDLKKFARGRYILYLDPDEIFPKESIKTVSKKINEFDYFCFPRKNIIFDKWIEHTRWWPDYQLRFFKKDTVIWPKTLHPEPTAKGVGYMFPAEEKYAILHYNYDNIDQYFEKAIRYAKWEAQSYIRQGKKLTLPETAKKAVSEFISRFWACEGYKDGTHGLILSSLQTFYYLLVYMYYWEAKKYEKNDQKTLVHSARIFFQSAARESVYWAMQKEVISRAEGLKAKIVNKLESVIKI